MITTLAGNNLYELKSRLDEIKTTFCDKFGKINLVNIDAEDASYEQIIDSVSNTSLFSSDRLVIIDNPNKNKMLSDNIEQVIALSSQSDIVIVLREIDKRAKIYKILKTKTQYQEFNTIDSHNLDSWVIEKVIKNDGNIDRSTAKFLIYRVGIDQIRLSHEIDKLITYDSQISKESIELLCENSPESNVFQLIDMAFSGNYSKTLELYEEQRLLSQEPIAILGMIIWQLHILAVVQASGNLSSSQIASKAKLSPFVVDKAKRILSKITKPQLKRIIRLVSDLDVTLKTESINADNALKQLLLEIVEIIKNN